MQPIGYRQTEEIPIFDAFEAFVVRNFGPREFEAIKPQIQKLHDTRIEIANMKSFDDVLLLENYEKMLVSYYIGMSFIQKKFTFGTKDDWVKLNFPWKDSRTGEKKSSKTELSLELNSILYNLAAVMNNIGTHTPIEGESIKSVSQKFQEAAWLFDYIKQTSDALPPSCRSYDFTIENLQYNSTIQLAQSQYWFFKKAEAGSSSPAILAKITYQLKSFFDDAANYLNIKRAAGKDASKGGLLTNIQFYWTYYNAIAHYYKGLEIKERCNEEGSGMGLAEGHLKYSLSQLNSCPTYDSTTKDALKQRIKNVEEEYQKVKEINKNVYYEACKSEKDLEKIDSKNYTLHRSIQVELEADYPGAENFEVFVPMEVRKLEGEFQQQANKIINQNLETLQKLSVNEDQLMKSYGLPQAIYSLSTNEEIPDDLWKRISEFQQRGNIQFLESLLAGVSQSRKNWVDIVGKCEKFVVDEENEDSSLRAIYGTKWQRLPSNSLNAEIKSRVNSYKGNLEKAFETDATVESNLEIIKPKMALLKLSRNELTQEMPRSVSSKAQSDPSVKNLESSITMLNDLRKQREDLVNNMSRGLESAEVRKDLFAVYQGNLDKQTAFDRHLESFNSFEAALEDQSAKSAEITSSIDENMASFNKLKSGKGNKEKLEFFASIDEGLMTYFENMNLLSNGAKFYKQMHTYLSSLHLYINDFVASRTVEKDDMLQALGGSSHPGAPGTPYNPYGKNIYGGGYSK